MISKREDLRFGKLIDLPTWRVVVAGYRNLLRLWETWKDLVPASALLSQAIQQADGVVRQQIESRQLDLSCESVYQIAARTAASQHARPDRRLTQVLQVIHLMIDAIAEYDLDSDAALFMASRSMELASQLGDERLVAAMLSDCQWISQSIKQSIPRETMLDAIGSLWPD